MPSDAEWKRIQEIERAYHERKEPEKVLPINRVYWKRVLDAARAEGVELGPRTRALDVGCGGCGILLGLDEGELTGIDPLMPFYLEKFPFLTDAAVTWLEGTAEELSLETTFDVIFSINSLDHVIDPAASALAMERLVEPGGRLVLVLNVHLTKLFRGYFSLFYRFVDPPHPHQIHRDRVAAFFPGLSLTAVTDIDHLWLDLEDEYHEEACHKEHKGLGKLARNLMNPFQYPIAAMRILGGRPVHRRKPDDRPLMASTLFVFSRPAVE
jgi:SAM-dependent methyltransferase